MAIDVRREIPLVLLRIGTPEAGRALVDALLEGDATVRYRVIASLNKLKRLHPEVVIDRSLVELLLAAEIAGHYRSHQILGALRRSLMADDPMFAAMNRSMEQERERIFRLLSLLLPDVDLQDAYVGLESVQATIRANSLEFLDNVLSPQLRQVLVPVPRSADHARGADSDCGSAGGGACEHRRSRDREPAGRHRAARGRHRGAPPRLDGVRRRRNPRARPRRHAPWGLTPSWGPTGAVWGLTPRRRSIDPAGSDPNQQLLQTVNLLDEVTDTRSLAIVGSDPTDHDRPPTSIWASMTRRKASTTPGSNCRPR